MDYQKKIEKYKNKYNLIKDQYGGRVNIGDTIQYINNPMYYIVVENKGVTFRIENGDVLRYLDEGTIWIRRDDPVDTFLELRDKTYVYIIEGGTITVPFNQISTLFIQARNYNIINYIIYCICIDFINSINSNPKWVEFFGDSMSVILENNQCIIMLPYNYKLTINSKLITINNHNNTIYKYIVLKGCITPDDINLKFGILLIDMMTNKVNDIYINSTNIDTLLSSFSKGYYEYDLTYLLTYMLLKNIRKYGCLLTCTDQHLNLNIPISVNRIVNLGENIIDNNYKLQFIDADVQFLRNIYLKYVENYYYVNKLDSISVRFVLYDNIISLYRIGAPITIHELYYHTDRKQFSYVFREKKKSVELPEHKTEQNLDTFIKTLDNWDIIYNDITICYDTTQQILYPLLTNPVNINYGDRRFSLIGASENTKSYEINVRSFEGIVHMFLMLNNFINRFRRLFVRNELILQQNIKLNSENTIASQALFIDYSSLLEEEKTSSKPKKPKEQQPEIPASEEKIVELLDETNDVTLPAGIVQEQYVLPYKTYFNQGLIKLLPAKQEEFVNKMKLNIQTYNPYLKIIRDERKCIIYLSNPDRVNIVHSSLFFEELIRGRFHFTHELLNDEVSHNYFNFKFSIGIKEIFIFNKRGITNIKEIIDYYLQLLDNSAYLNDRGVELLTRMSIDSIKEKTHQSILEIFNYIIQFIKENYIYFGPFNELD
jgi:hypothetical protein